MHNCTDCGRTIDNDVDGRGLCEDCGRKRYESQDERRHEGDEKHGK
jgi:predicted  nucleic acid-binding Zn-ribbon protein